MFDFFFAQEACEEYSVPQHVFDHLDLVIPSVHFDLRSQANQSQSPPANLGSRQHQLRKRELNGMDVGEGSPRVRKPLQADLRTTSSGDGLSYCDQTTTLDCLRSVFELFPGILTQPD